MRISVIIPTYNRCSSLKRALQSVLQQHFSPHEIIVIDDCSDDDTPHMELLHESRMIRYFRLSSRRGPAAARNTGVSCATGDWIAFLDSDDVWHVRKLQRQKEWVSDNPQLRILQTREIWVRNGVRVNPPRTHVKRAGDIFYHSLQRCMITPSSVLLQRSLFDQAGGFNESLAVCEDYDLWVRITARYPVGLVPELLLTRYGGHSDQLSSVVDRQDRFRIRALLDLLKTGILTPEQQRACRDMVRKKAHIMANGCRKRGKEYEYAQYRRIAEDM